MKYETNSGFTEPIPAYDVVRRALATLVVLAAGIASALAVGIAFVYGAELAGGSLAVVFVGWAAGIGIALTLPFVVVRVVSAAFAAFRL